MTFEKKVDFTPEGETLGTQHNLNKLSEDFPNLFEKTTEGVSINLDNFGEVSNEDMPYLAYYSNEGGPSVEDTLVFYIEENPIEKEFVKGFHLSTKLGISSQDVEKTSTIVKGGIDLSLTRYPDEELVISFLTKTERDCRVPLTCADVQGSHFFLTEDTIENEVLWDGIREIFLRDLGYFINKIHVSYDVSDEELNIDLILD